jgi:predicted nucleotidyltransferase
MSMANIDEGLIKAIRLAEGYPSILKMGVFGSFARGEQTEKSDIDIIYDYDDTMIDDMLNCLNAIEKRLGRKTDFIAYYLLIEDGIDELDAVFRDSALKDLVWIYEKIDARKD